MKNFLLIVLIIVMVFSTTACSIMSSADTNVVSTLEVDDQKDQDQDQDQDQDKDQDKDKDQDEDGFKVIKTALGKVKGIREDGYLVFKGLRYATAERWEDAVPVTAWKGVYDATEFGDRSLQSKSFYPDNVSVVSQFYDNESIVHFPETYSEDSLNLNIWTPENAENAPVIFYIHGGSNLNGGGSDPWIDGQAYCEQGVILVSINYRLNAFAIVYGDGYVGDYNLTDAITALKWVKENIKDYGGDPDRIIVMGESAGAVNTQDLLISPMAEGLFSGAIMMSGGGDLSALPTPVAPTTIEMLWDKVKENLGVEDLSEVQKMDAKVVYDAWLAAVAQVPEAKTTFNKPIVNGDVLTMNTTQAVAAGKQMDVPVILGVLSEDSFPFMLYNAAIKYGINQSNAGKAPVYSYFFDRQQEGDNTFGAFHAVDLFYAFGTLDRNWRPYTEIDYRISDNMVTYFSNFAKTGNPNSEDLPQWQPVTETNKMSLRFGDDEAAMYQVPLAQLLETQKTRSPYPYITK